MNKAELALALESKLGSRKLAHDALEAFLETIIREVARGCRVSITGFGTFQKVERGARTGRNPRTGEEVRIRKTTVPRFRPGTSFRGRPGRGRPRCSLRRTRPPCSTTFASTNFMNPRDRPPQ